MLNAKMERGIARCEGRRESEDVDGFNGSFMELLIEEDDERELVREEKEGVGFVLFPTNRFLSVSSTSSLVQMVCFGGEEDYDNDGVFSTDQKCKPRTRRNAMPTIGMGRGGGRYGKCKKTKAEASPVSRAVQMRREKLGSHVRALQQLVSPMGKSDTASVLQEAFGYIRFLHDQVQALSTAYKGAEIDSAIQPGSRVGEGYLRKRGLCLVPVSSTATMLGINGSDMGAAISFNTGRTAAISPVGSNH